MSTPRMVHLFSLVLAFTSAGTGVFAQDTWCGKNYMSTQPIVPPGGQFPTPATSSSPLLALRCAQAIKPYLASDDPSSAAFLVDSVVTHSHIVGAEPIDLPSSSGGGGPSQGQVLALKITASPIAATTGSNGTTDAAITLANAIVPLNSTKFNVPFSLSKLKASASGYAVTCAATFSSQHFSTTTKLAFLPDPTDGTAVTKMDAKTGALLKRPFGASGDKGTKFEPVFPVGYYTQFDNYLAANLSILDELKEQGFTVVHPIPTYTDQTALLAILDRMAQLGLHLMYDMRSTYTNLSSVSQQVELIKNHPALLVWYTADEPDGWSDPQNATLAAHDLIQQLDGGGYHPVSLVLNCQDFFFEQYASGAEIVMQDVYTVGNNLSFSSQWNTPCTDDYGDCGCDNCHKGFEDIADRMDQFAERLFVLGRELGSAVWAVPQGFGNDTYWKRFPTGNEWVVQAIVGINHGALGVVSWDDPTSTDIKAVSSKFSKSLPSITPFIFSHTASFGQITINKVDVGIWQEPSLGTLVLATNMNYKTVEVTWKDIGLGAGKKVKEAYGGDASASGQGVRFGQVGSGAWILS